ncbi:MAG TPA: SIMPL domain-containing protein [Caulobacteraceae bacterium]
MKPILRLAIAAAALVFAAPALAQPSSDARFAATTLDIAGHGEARVPPDQATLVLGVTTDRPTAVAAMQANAADMTRVVAALRAAGIRPADIQTSTLAVSPQYDYAQGAAPRLTGYQATNQVTVTTQDLAHLGRLVDAASTAGATNVGQISFGLRNRGSAENFARLAAVKDLDDKAQIYADAAGYHIRRLVNLSEASAELPSPRPMMAMAAMRGAPAPTPVETGEIVVSVDVTGEFELTH